MKKQARSTSVLLMATLLIVLAILMISVKIMDYSVNAENSEAIAPSVGEHIPLSNTQIAEKWPNLPSVEQIIHEKNSYTCVHYDPTVFGNYTTTIPNLMQGGLITNVPMIYLQPKI